MWFYILLTILVVPFVWWLTSTNLYRHRSRFGPDLRGSRFGSTGDSARNNLSKIRPSDGKRLR